MAGVVFALVILGFIAWQVWLLGIRPRQRRKAFKKQSFPAVWSKILGREVVFYSRLSADEKRRFERLVKVFLAHVKVTGIKTEVSDTDRLLVAAAAIIPLFRFNIARYPNVNEVLLYPRAFDNQYNFEEKKGSIQGMVGNRHLNNTVLLSKTALRHGFRDARDGKNTAIHEFIHLIDAWDGSIDGIPEALLCDKTVGPWMELMKEKTTGIHQRKIKDIDPYATKNPAEFLAVTAEYFFENPERMQKKHPQLFEKLKAMFIGNH
jgi:Mlc titration factor MtfA (ptsG expression regulator)